MGNSEAKTKDLTNVGGETIADIKNGDCLTMTDSLRNGLQKTLNWEVADCHEVEWDLAYKFKDW